MLTEPAPLTLHGPDGPVHLAGGRIVADDPGGRRIDVVDLRVMPGIVDVHGDGFERHLAPRRGAATDPAEGLGHTEAELLANGITTAVLSQYWSWEGGMRGPEFARRIATALDAYPATVDLRLQLRIEIGMVDDYPEIEALVARHRIGFVTLNDHLPHHVLASDKPLRRLEGQALKAGRSPEAHLGLLNALHSGMDAAMAALPGLVARLVTAGAIVGSHDDPTPEARAAFRDMGASVAEFPLSAETATAARAAGDPVVVGAPNLVRGASHKRGGFSVAEALALDAVDALASDYHYPSCLAAMRRLSAAGWPADRAWALVSEGPARVLGLSDRGRIAPGLRADLVLVDPDFTRVHGTIVGGRVAHADAVLSARLLA
ncbi:alpha-D-ribose 1-methylphosphonate 5-triphosphate diphosphatase [Rhodobacterales bacterium HKCCE3408]|nr:alpha-D-ribose 1-methylphosphonate 5-triphosphate diphosphatase [Rhodobacterales bacterium HKCCE3408]